MNDHRYQVLQILGQSRWVCTYRALDQSQSPPRTCVIKQVKIGSADSPNYSVNHALNICQLVQERCAAAQHPQLPDWIDAFVDPAGNLYWVQDYIAGESLASLLKQESVSSTDFSSTDFSSTDIWDILANLLPVLQQLHQHQVMHGDIKPENLICRDGAKRLQNLVLVDSALPNLIELPCGDPAYAAPEQVRGEATFASDLYSLGLTCLHLLTGLSPITLVGLDQWPDFCGPDLPSSLIQLLNGLTAPDPAQRYTSATAAIAALEQLRGQKLKPVLKPIASNPMPPWICWATLTGHQGLFATVNAVAVSPDSAWLASASDDQTVRLWSGAAASAEVGQLVGHQGFVRAVAFHPSAPRLASGSQDRTIRIWDYPTRQIIQVLAGHGHRVNAVAFSPDGQLLASGSSDKTIKLWQNDQCLTTLKGHRLAVNGLAFSPDGGLLVSGSSDGTVRFWDLATQSCRQVLTEHRQAVRAVAVSPTRIASGGEDRVIHLWNWAGELCQTLPGHAWPVSGLAFAPDGQTLASASWDKTLKLWQVETGAELAVLTGHSDSVCGVCFSPQGDSVISASQDKTLRIWRCTQP